MTRNPTARFYNQNSQKCKFILQCTILKMQGHSPLQRRWRKVGANNVIELKTHALN